MIRRIALLLFIVKCTCARGPPLADVNLNGSILFSLSDANFEHAFEAYIPVLPSLHSFDKDGFIEYRNATISVNEDSTIGGMVASYEDGKFWSSSTRGRQLVEVNVRAGPRYRGIKKELSFIFSLAYDSVTKMLYWSQGKFAKLGVIETIGNRFSFAILREFVGVDPHGLAVHTTKRMLFVVLLNLKDFSVSKIIRTDLDGGNPVTIMSYPHALIIKDITVDYATDRLFFTDYSITSGSAAVFSCNLDGSNKQQMFAIPGIGLTGVGVANGYIYTANAQNNSAGDYFIHMRRVDGGEIKNLKLKLLPIWISVYSPEEPQASSVPNECLDNKCEHLCVASFNGSFSCKCSDGYILVDGYKCEATVLDDNYLIVADLGQKELLKLPVQSTNATDVPAAAGTTKGLTTETIYAFTIDYKNGGLIFYKEDVGDQKIVWGEKSMPFEQQVNTIVAHCCEDIIYWITNENIYSWDGKSAEYTTLPYVFEFYLSFGIIDMTIDCVTNHLYWTEYSSLMELGSVKRSDLNGNNVETVLENLPLAYGLTIDYETHTLHVASLFTNNLYSVPLPQDTIRNTSIHSAINNVTDFSVILTKEIQPFIRDVTVVNGMVYLVGDQRVYRFPTGDPASLEPYGPNIFYRSPQVMFYNRSYHDGLVESLCVKPTTSLDLTTTDKQREDCRSLLAKALASSDGYVNALHLYITCVVKSLLPDIISGERSIGIEQLGLPRLP